MAGNLGLLQRVHVPEEILDRWTGTDDFGRRYCDTWQESDLKADDVSVQCVQQGLEKLVLKDSGSKAVHIVAHNAHQKIGIRSNKFGGRRMAIG